MLSTRVEDEGGCVPLVDAQRTRAFDDERDKSATRASVRLPAKEDQEKSANALKSTGCGRGAQKGVQKDGRAALQSGMRACAR